MSPGAADPKSGVVPGATLNDAAARAAGALAELGEDRIEVLVAGTEPRVISSRKTDLPGLIRGLAGAEGGVLRCLGLGVVITVGRDAIGWRASDGETARRLADALGV